MEYIWKKFPKEIIKGDNITESGFNYEEEYEKRVYKKVWMDIAWYCGRNGRRIFVLAVCKDRKLPAGASHAEEQKLRYVPGHDLDPDKTVERDNIERREHRRVSGEHRAE